MDAFPLCTLSMITCVLACRILQKKISKHHLYHWYVFWCDFQCLKQQVYGSLWHMSNHWHVDVWESQSGKWVMSYLMWSKCVSVGWCFVLYHNGTEHSVLLACCWCIQLFVCTPGVERVYLTEQMVPCWLPVLLFGVCFLRSDSGRRV